MRLFLLFLFFLFLTVSASAQESSRTLSPIKLAEDNRDANAPALKNALHSRIADQRREAAIAWGRIMKPEGIDPLLLLSKDTNLRVQESALFSLGQMGWKPESVGARVSEIETFLKSLFTTTSPKTASLILDAMAKLVPEDGFDSLTPYLVNPDSKVRAAAALSIYRYSIAFRNRTPDYHYPAFSPSLVQMLLPLTNDTDGRVRLNATLALSKMKSPFALNALVARLSDSNLWTKYYALQGIGGIADPSAVKSVTPFLEASAYSLRVEAINAIQKMGAASTLPSSLKDDLSVHVRSAFAAATKTNLLMDQSPLVRTSSIIALLTQASGDALTALLQVGLHDKSAFVRANTLDATANFSETVPNLENMITPYLDDTEVTVRASAIQALSQFDSSTSREMMVKELLTSPDLSVRSTAFSILSAATPPPAFDLTQQALQNSFDGKWLDLRLDFVRFYSSIPGAETTELLKSMLKDPSPKVAFAAWKVLSLRQITGLSVLTEPLPVRAPDAGISFGRNPHLILFTSKGKIDLELFAKEAPIHVAHIFNYAKNGGYNGTPWHRIVTDFVVQGGDPDRTGWGNGGYPLRAEINPVQFTRGTLGMPRSDDFDSGGVQLFITHVPTPSLDGLYTVFGRVRHGMTVIDQLEPGDLILSTKVRR